MPTDLGNLLIRVTSVGFDDVLRDLEHLGEVLDGIGSNSALGQISRQLDQMSRYMKDMHGDLGDIVLKNNQIGKSLGKSGESAEESGKRFSALEKILKRITAVAASFWAVVAVPRRFINTMENVAAFNMSLTNMAMNANMARSTIVTLGTAVEGLGGSRQGLASTAARFRSMLHGLRMGRGGGSLMEAASLYGLSLRGTGPNGLATEQEQFRNIAELFERMGNDPVAKLRKLDIKDMLGLDDGTFKLLNKGVKEYNRAIEESKRHHEMMASAMESAQKVTEAKAKTEQAWADAQAKMLEVVNPLITEFERLKGRLFNFARDNPLAAVLATLTTGIIGAVGGFKLLQKIIGSLFGDIAKSAAGAAASSAAGSVSSSSGGLSSAGRAAGGFATSGFASGVGIVSQLTSAVSNAVTALSNVDLVKGQIHISAELDAFHGDFESLAQSVYKWRDADTGLTAGPDYEPILNQIHYVQNSIDENHVSLLEFLSTSKGGGCNVTIPNVSISVTSSDADPKEVANAVRSELVSQIRFAMLEASNRSRIL